MKNMRFIKTFVVMIISIFAIIVSTQNSSAIILVNEGFEENITLDGTPSGILYESAGDCVCSNGPVECSYAAGTCGSNFGNAVSIQSVFKHSGTRSMRGDLNVVGGAGVSLSPSSYGFQNKTNLWLRYYVYYAPGFRWYEWTKQVVWRIDNAPDLYINCGGRTWPWAMANGAQRCDLNIYFGMSPSGACDNIWPWTVDYHDPAWSVTHPSIGNLGEEWLISPGGWYYIEVHLDTINRSLDLWMKRPQDTSVTQVITNQSVAGCTNFDSGGGEYFSDLEVDNFLNSTAGPSGGTFYVDDIVIADRYIGPTEVIPDTTPPAAPTGLAVR